jgi:hypothetical protein
MGRLVELTFSVVWVVLPYSLWVYMNSSPSGSVITATRPEFLYVYPVVAPFGFALDEPSDWVPPPVVAPPGSVSEATWQWSL